LEVCGMERKADHYTTCNKCNALMEKTAKQCPKCGAVNPAQKKKKKKTTCLTGYAIIVTIIALGLLLALEVQNSIYISYKEKYSDLSYEYSELLEEYNQLKDSIGK
jgi:RNA polymerase subunit RPABC4/transcription elongation factor Spt4